MTPSDQDALADIGFCPGSQRAGGISPVTQGGASFDNDGLLSTKQVATALNINRQALTRAIGIGFLRCVRVPHFDQSMPCRWRTTTGEVRAYHQRLDRWRETYLGKSAVIKALGLERYDLEDYQSDWPVISMMRSGHYASVVHPAQCEFLNSNWGHFWHRDEIEMFRRWILLAASGKLEHSPEHRWCDRSSLWVPPYPALPGEELDEGYTEETITRRAALAARSHALQSAGASD